MLKLAQVMAGAPQGGAENHYVRLILALHQDTDIEQLPILRTHAERQATLTHAGLSPITMRFGGPIDLGTQIRLRRTLQDFGPDVVLTWMSRAAHKCPAGPWKLAARLGGYYNLKYYRRIEYFIGISGGICRYLAQNAIPGDKIWHIPNFADETPAPPTPRAAHDTPGDVPLLLAAGRLHRSKGFDVLLDAIAGLPDVWLWIAGEGPERTALERQIERLALGTRVRLLGWQPRIMPHLAAADLFVCSSRHEPLGSIVLEAWAHRRALVACAAQGPRELIQHGLNGLLCPTDDPEALRHAIGLALDDKDLREHLVEHGQSTYTREYSRVRHIERYREFFQAVTGPIPASQQNRPKGLP